MIGPGEAIPTGSVDPWALLAWGGLALLGLAGSALWSGSETGFYCLSRVRLDVRLHRHGDRAAQRVRDELAQPNRLLATILLGNNVCNYLGTLGVTMLLESAGFSPGLTVVLQMIVLTPMLLVFGESLPKEIFRLNADSWPYALSGVLKAVRLAATAVLVLPVLMWVSRLALRIAGDGGGAIELGGTRRLLGLIEESAHAGAISGVQGALAERALAFERTVVGDVMVPWRSVDRLRLDWSNERATDAAVRTTRTWLPVTDRLSRVRGVVHAIDLIDSLGGLGTEGGPELVVPVVLDPDEPVRTAIGRLAMNPAGIAVVMAGGKPIGLVGRHDLVRPLLGRAGPQRRA